MYKLLLFSNTLLLYIELKATDQLILKLCLEFQSSKHIWFGTFIGQYHTSFAPHMTARSESVLKHRYLIIFQVSEVALYLQEDQYASYLIRSFTTRKHVCRMNRLIINSCSVSKTPTLLFHSLLFRFGRRRRTDCIFH